MWVATSACVGCNLSRAVGGAEGQASQGDRVELRRVTVLPTVGGGASSTGAPGPGPGPGPGSGRPGAVAGPSGGGGVEGVEGLVSEGGGRAARGPGPLVETAGKSQNGTQVAAVLSQHLHAQPPEP